MRAAVLLLLFACREEPASKHQVIVSDSSAGAPDVITGAIVDNGVAITPTACRVLREPISGQTVLVVEAITPRGTLRFANAQLVWKGSVLACTKLDRSWGGGSRTDGTHYWRGMLDFVCGAVTGKLELDCGGITPAERAQLDANREKSRPQD